MGIATGGMVFRGLAAGAALAGGLALSVPATTAGAARQKGAEVHVAHVAGRGTVLVDGNGHTLYAFSPDNHRRPTCHGTCTSIWPPLTTTGKPVAGKGIKESHLGTVTNAAGKRQVTYDHWPLYTFVQDTRSGEAAGQGISSFGGHWSTVGTGGSPFQAPAHTTRHAGGSGSGSGW